MKCIELKDLDVIPFVPTTREYGRAVFQICLKYTKNKTKLYIYAKQQPHASDCYFKWEGKGIRTITIPSYDNLDYVRLLSVGYCKDHKSTTMLVMVPHMSNGFRFEVFSDSLSIGFIK